MWAFNALICAFTFQCLIYIGNGCEIEKFLNMDELQDIQVPIEEFNKTDFSGNYFDFILQVKKYLL